MIKLTLTDEMAKIVAEACEFYARIRMGQFQEIIYKTLEMNELGADDYCLRRDAAEKFLFEARKFLYPELYGRGHSYGVGKFDDADIAFDVYQVIRKEFGDPRGFFSFRAEVPVAERVEECQKRN